MIFTRKVIRSRINLKNLDKKNRESKKSSDIRINELSTKIQGLEKSKDELQKRLSAQETRFAALNSKLQQSKKVIADKQN